MNGEILPMSDRDKGPMPHANGQVPPLKQETVESIFDSTPGVGRLPEDHEWRTVKINGKEHTVPLPKQSSESDLE